MKKLLKMLGILGLLLLPSIAAADSNSGSIAVSLLSNCTVQQGLIQLNSLGWKPSSYVLTPGIDTNVGELAVSHNTYSPQIVTLFADQNATNAQWTALEDTIRGSLSTANCIQYWYIEHDPDSLNFKKDTDANYSNVWTDLPGMSCAQYKGSGIPGATSPKLIGLDMNKANKYYDPDVTWNQIDDGGEPANYWDWLTANNVYSPHANNVAWAVMQTGNPYIYSRAVGRPLDVYQIINEAVQSGQTNGTAQTGVAYYPMLFNPGSTNSPISDNAAVLDIAHILRGSQDTILVASTSHSKPSDTLPLLPPPGMESLADPDNDILVVGQSFVSEPHTPPEVTSCGVGVDMVLEFSQVQVPGSGSGYVGQVGSSYAVAPIANVLADIARRYNLTDDQLMTVAINSTRVANNKAVRDNCEGWGKFDACAAYDYAERNYPVVTWTPDWIETILTVDFTRPGDVWYSAFIEKCNLLRGSPHTFSGYGYNDLIKCATTNPYTGPEYHFKLFYDRASPVPERRSAYPNGIPTLPPTTP
jgi:hypothetical protein